MYFLKTIKVHLVRTKTHTAVLPGIFNQTYPWSGVVLVVSMPDLCTLTYIYKYVKFKNILSWLLLKNMVTTQMETIIYNLLLNRNNYTALIKQILSHYIYAQEGNRKQYCGQFIILASTRDFGPDKLNNVIHIVLSLLIYVLK